jgi:hypothetical protein
MVNNFTKINKTNNNPSIQLTDHNIIPRHMVFEIPILAWNSHNNVAGLIFSWYNTPPLLITGSLMVIHT